MPLIALLTGPLGKIAGYATLALAILTAGAIALHQHDARVLAEQRAAAQAAQIAAMQADHARAVTALEADAASAREAAARAQTTKVAIHAAPPSQGCVDRPAIAAALAGLHNGSGAGHPAPPGAGVPVVVPAAAGTAAAGR